jgi:tetratricopeptide (TPR) repeat protein
MNLPLALIRINRPIPPVAAGWLSTADPVEWLKEIAHCRAQGCAVSIFPVAASTAEPRAVGIILVPCQKVPRFRSRVVPLGEIQKGVFAPLDAGLAVGLLPNERDFFFSYTINFFHPTIGVVGFEWKDELAPSRLLSTSPQRGQRWNLSVPVDRFAPEFREMLIDNPASPDEMLESAAQEIGDQSGKPSNLTEGISKAAAMLGMGLVGGVFVGASYLFGALGKNRNPTNKKGADQGNGSLKRLNEWAEKNWQKLMDSRSREIDRLIKLMEKDPDAGLRYALPLAGIEQSRGVASRSWKLGQRGTRFSHGHGGGAIDGWDLANEARLNLEKQYREAAKREIALGRFDRAAYIYGNLLGDWQSAARTLAECGRHQDAVSVYLHKLNNPAAAARSLEDAGLLHQAAGIYAECKQFEKAGDLHSQLGNDIKARELWSAEIQAQRDPLEQARILTHKLRDTDTALTILDTAWRSGNRPQQALSAMFSIHRDRETFEDGLRLLGRMFEQEVGSLPLIEKLHLGHAECAHFDTPAFSSAFEDEAYQRIGRALSANESNSASLLGFLPKLDGADLLLSRDAKRYSIKKAPPKIPTTGPPQGVIRPKQVIPLPPNMRWDSLAALPDGLSIAGFGDEMLCAAQVRDGSCHSSALRTPHIPGKSEVRHVAVNSARGTSRLFHLSDLKRIHYQPIQRAKTAADDAISDLRNILATCPHGSDGDFALLQYTHTSSLSVSIFSEAAILRRTFPIDLASPEIAGLNWRMAGRGGHLCFSAEGFVAWRTPSGEFITMNLGESPASLNISPVESLSEILISLSTDVLLVQVSKTGKTMETVNLFSDPSLSKGPVSCYLPDGSVVIAQKGSGVVYPRGNWLKPCSTFSIPTNSGDPVDICSLGTDGFSILTSTGKLVIF